MTPMPRSAPLDVTIITGMSGAGRSEAAHVLEDLGFFVIDNLPPMLIGKVAELARGHDTPTRYALVVDVRSGDFLHDLSPRSTSCAQQGAHHPRPVPRRVRRRARAPLRGEPAPASALRFRARQRRHRARARAARTARGRGRPARRHVDLNVHELRDRLRELFSEHGRPTRRCSQRRVVRLQARPPARRRPRVRLPLPAEPALGRRAAPAHRARRTRCATTCSPAAAPRVPRRARPAVRADCCRVTSARARRTSRSRSAAPAAATAAS
jgi:hypothetical protein